MSSSINQHQKNLGTAIHVSVFSRYIIPCGNFIAPVVLWMLNKKEMFIDENGKRAINFQISMFLYQLLCVLAIVPFVVWKLKIHISELSNTMFEPFYFNWSDQFTVENNILLLIAIAIFAFSFKIFEIVQVIQAAIKAHRGEIYKYPISIAFIK